MGQISVNLEAVLFYIFRGLQQQKMQEIDWGRRKSPGQGGHPGAYGQAVESVGH